MKRYIAGLFFIMMTILTFSACQKETEEKIEDIEFTVVNEDELPAELKTAIDAKKQQEFKLLYTDSGYLYIVVGYGEQASSGYSIAVNALYLTADGIVIDTDLIGPSANEASAAVLSYPFVVVKTEARDENVNFRS